MTTLAICENGHLVSFSVVNASVRTHLFEDGRVDIMGMPVATVELLPNFCRDCGGEVLAECGICNHAIPQNSHPQDALPSFCENCGEPYPWASREQLIGRLRTFLNRDKRLSPSDRQTLIEQIEILATPEEPGTVKARVRAAQRIADLAPGVWSAAQPVLTRVLSTEVLQGLSHLPHFS